ncbi:MAG: tetratricopeptide repeat protein, partial [Myxococcota bacterium]
SNGRPYIAMEYVSGADLVTHCDLERMTLEDRVRLFLEVCDGVQHAHQKGIIHRDLKPNNVLVKVRPKQPPTPKLIDFGIAKSLTRKLNPDAAGTQFGVLLGTLHYSSPEQITGRYSRVDTRSDIYSLGVMLYELLAGVPPRDETDFQGRTQFELAEMLESSNTPPLLHRYTQLDNTQEVAKRRRATVADVKRALSSDLSWIVTRCLERDPDGRYPSANDLRADLLRWLDGKPVEARRTTSLYRLRKSARRHWRAVLFSAVAGVALLATTMLAVFGLVSARRSEQRARQAAEEARRAAEEARLAAEFQTKVLRSFDPQELGTELRASLSMTADDNQPSSALGETSSLDLDAINFTDLQVRALEKTVFAAAEASIDDEYADHPLLQATLWQSLADTLRKIGLLDAAVSPQDKAIGARERLLPPDDELTLESLASRRDLRAERLDNDGQLSDSRRIVEARRRLGDPSALARALGGHALSLWGFHDLDALDIAKEALAIERELHGPGSREALRASMALGQILLRGGYLSEAEKLYHGCTRILRSLEFPEKQEHLEDCRRRRAVALAWMGRGSEAEPILRAVVESRVARLGNQHPRTLLTRYQLASVLEEREKFDAAEAHFAELVEVYESKAMPPVNYARYRLAHARRMLGKIDKAESTLDEIDLSSLPPAMSTVSSYVSLERAGLLVMRGRYLNAIAVSRKALDLLKGDPLRFDLVAQARITLGRAFLHLDRFSEAETEFNAAWTALSAVPGGQRPRWMRYVAEEMVKLYTEWPRARGEVVESEPLLLWNKRLSDIREMIW